MWGNLCELSFSIRHFLTQAHSRLSESGLAQACDKNTLFNKYL